MYYNIDRLNKDLKLITEVLGERRSHGFFTVAVFKDSDFEIINPYISGAELFYKNGDQIKKEELEIDSDIGQTILQKAIEAEEWFVGNLGLNVSGFCNGDYAKSMPVSRDEWNKVIEWEIKNNEHGTLSYWIHLE